MNRINQYVIDSWFYKHPKDLSVGYDEEHIDNWVEEWSIEHQLTTLISTNLKVRFKGVPRVRAYSTTRTDGETKAYRIMSPRPRGIILSDSRRIW